jgi:hypothetical protein
MGVRRRREKIKRWVRGGVRIRRRKERERWVRIWWYGG